MFSSCQAWPASTNECSTHPTKSRVRAVRPVSSRIPRRSASSTLSPGFTFPPGNEYQACPRRLATRMRSPAVKSMRALNTTDVLDALDAAVVAVTVSTGSARLSCWQKRSGIKKCSVWTAWA